MIWIQRTNLIFLIELIVAYSFLCAGQYEEAGGVTGGLGRVLRLVAEWEWDKEPIDRGSE